MILALALAASLASAKPPEPLEEILPRTQLIVEAVVVEAKTAPGADKPRQDLLLEITRVVRGKLAEKPGADGKVRIRVVKPAGTAMVKPGVRGPWLLHVDEKTGERTVLGRYGPDSWTLEKIEAKLAELDPPQLR